MPNTHGPESHRGGTARKAKPAGRKTADTRKGGGQTEPAPPGPEHRRLDAFVGTWKTRGQQHESPFGPAAKFTATESYEWLAGGFFLVHRLNGHFGDSPAACIEVIGHDPARRAYALHTFYNNGTTNAWELREQSGTWTLTGEWDTPEGPVQVRCVSSFGHEGRSITGTWEYSNDGSSWRTFLEATSTRA